jgi:hypothetical protein
MVFYGLDVTHVDSLAHIFWDGKLYGGVPASMVTDRQGALVHDVLADEEGVSSRGVLLDIARLRGVDVLSPRTRRRPVTAPCTCRSTWSASSRWACG